MPLFFVVLQGKGEGDKDSYFTKQNEVVENMNQAEGWSDFNEASKAAARARLQDGLNRKIFVID